MLAKTHKDKSNERDKSSAQSNEQSYKNKDKGNGNSGTSDSENPQNNYDQFQKSLFNKDNTKGFATKPEIKDCFNTIYNIQPGDSTLIPSTS